MKHFYKTICITFCVFASTASWATLLTITPPGGLTIDGQTINGGEFTVWQVLGVTPDTTSLFGANPEFLCPDCGAGGISHTANFSMPSTHTLTDTLVDTAAPLSVLIYSFDPDGTIGPIFNTVYAPSLDNLTIVLPTLTDPEGTGRLSPFNVEDQVAAVLDPTTVAAADQNMLYQITDRNGLTGYGLRSPAFSDVPIIDPTGNIFDMTSFEMGDDLFASFLAGFRLDNFQPHGTTDTSPTNGGGMNGGGMNGGGDDGGGDDGGGMNGGGMNGGGDDGGGDDGGTVPEPSIIALFAIGLFGLGIARRRKA